MALFTVLEKATSSSVMDRSPTTCDGSTCEKAFNSSRDSRCFCNSSDMSPLNTADKSCMAWKLNCSASRCSAACWPRSWTVFRKFRSDSSRDSVHSCRRFSKNTYAKITNEHVCIRHFQSWLICQTIKQATDQSINQSINHQLIIKQAINQSKNATKSSSREPKKWQIMLVKLINELESFLTIISFEIGRIRMAPWSPVASPLPAPAETKADTIDN